MADKDVKCSECDVPAQVVFEENIPQTVACPQCGTSQSYAEFEESTGQQMVAYAAASLSRTFKKRARDNKNVTYRPGIVSPNSPKFLVDLTE